jgi:dolichyl-phosphate-mannose-protein mannosyltransferase
MMATHNQPRSLVPLKAEVIAVSLLTIVGLLLRLWGLGMLGLDHFDEGIYAAAGLWVTSPRSLAGMDPTVISYAPGGFPFLVGIAYLGMGVGAFAAILPSILLGTLTIPAISWLARRTFGPGAGASAAAMAALSGFHVAYSRMALTDASFLLFWVLALVAGQRFLEGPGPVRGIVLGLAVGLAQWFKYNGWLAGLAVILTACFGLIVDARERERPRMRSVWGAGLVAALAAAAIYWPWFGFVERHGGYGALLRHHRSYVGGLSSWYDHWRLQLEQATVLSGSRTWNLAGASLACLAGALCTGIRPDLSRSVSRVVVPIALIVLLTVAPASPWWLGIPWVLRRWNVSRPGERLLLVAWTGLSILTPFYHPYARLWLPLFSIGWVLVGGVVSWAMAIEPGPDDATAHRGRRSRLAVVATVLCASLAVLQGLALRVPPHGGTGLPEGDSPPPGLSLNAAVSAILKDLPPEVTTLELLVRPSVTFYLGGRIPARAEPDLDHLLAERTPRAWALVDFVQLRQGGDLRSATDRLLERWELAGRYPSCLSLPTLLDVDPGAARAGRSDMLDASLLLLRPKRRAQTR